MITGPGPSYHRKGIDFNVSKIPDFGLKFGIVADEFMRTSCLNGQGLINLLILSRIDLDLEACIPRWKLQPSRSCRATRSVIHSFLASPKFLEPEALFLSLSPRRAIGVLIV